VGSSPKSVLTAEEAAEYTIENVLTSAWSPLEITESTEAPVLTSSNTAITWDFVEYAICYVILCNNDVVFFTMENRYVPESPDTNLTYSVYAVSHTGALSAISNTITLKAPNEIISVTVTPFAVTLKAGQTQQFEADVSFTGNAFTLVDWTVTGNLSAETTISYLGLLTVAANETATTLNITAISVFDNDKKGTATVTVTTDPDTSIEYNNTKSTNMFANVYPNPTEGKFIVEFDMPGNYTLSVTDMSGKILSRQTTKEQQTQIDISALPTGTYLLIIDDGKMQSTTKVIKNM